MSYVSVHGLSGIVPAYARDIEGGIFGRTKLILGDSYIILSLLYLRDPSGPQDRIELTLSAMVRRPKWPFSL